MPAATRQEERMETALRDFLEIPYDKLEEMNLEAKDAAPRPQAAGQDPRGAHEVPDRREAHQGRHGLLQRPRRPPAHARLRQEVPAQVGRQPDLRRLLDPRLLARRRSRICAWASTGRRSTGCPPTSSAPARCWCSAKCSSKDGTPYARRHARRAQGVTPTSCTRRTATIAQRRQRDRRLPVQGPRRRAALPRDRQVRVHHHRRLLPLAAGRPAAHASSTPRPKCSARMGFAEREGPPRSGAVAVRDELLLRRSRASPPTRCSSTS